MSQITFITTCMGRLSFLQQSLPTLVAQGHDCVVVDYDCPERCGAWVEERFPQVKVVKITGRRFYHGSHARNIGAAVANSPWLCFVDADVSLAPSFSEAIAGQLQPDSYCTAAPWQAETAGTVVCPRAAFEKVGGYDEVIQGWGAEDVDIFMRFRFAGLKLSTFPTSLLQVQSHSLEVRMAHHENKDIAHSLAVNRCYVTVKNDLMTLTGQVLDEPVRRRLYEGARKAIFDGNRPGQVGVFRVDFAQDEIARGYHCTSALSYTVHKSPNA